MKLKIEILKDEEIVKNIIADFSMKEEYYKLHEYIKKSGIKFEIQEYHDVFILPLKYSENELFIELLNEYYKTNPIILEVYNTFINTCIDKIYMNNASIESSNLKSHKKVAALELVSKSIESSQIQLGGNLNSTSDLTNLMENIKSQISKHQTPINKLTPKFETFFYEEMLRVLFEGKLISGDFKDPNYRFEWVKFAFYFDDENNNTSNSLQTLNWIDKSSKLAEFLVFLFSNLIVYKFSNKKEFINWIIQHIEINGNSIRKDSKNFRSLNRLIKKFKGEPSTSFRISDANLFEIGYFITPLKNQKTL
ncbi:MAG: hypothetical protein FGM14_16805 [Flavobacteriales bacterium]|nr:hypothetical protein [Flavobacteriales bacterium]